jgi:periplasmic divalent cation tolerance protein
MKQSGYIVVLITAKDAGEAQEIAEKLLKSRQAACVTIVPEVDSQYWWQGRLDAARESLLIVKSREARLPDIIKSGKQIHSYDLPEIIALPVVGGSGDYLDWIDVETKHEA